MSALAPDHKELAEFPAYAEGLKTYSKISFSSTFIPFDEKRPIRPSDFENYGAFIHFELVADMGDRRIRRATKSLYFPNLNLSLYSHLNLWEDASPELQNMLNEIMENHKAMLSELDEKSGDKVINMDEEGAATPVTVGEG